MLFESPPCSLSFLNNIDNATAETDLLTCHTHGTGFVLSRGHLPL
jgi:hypothetical protein